MVNENEPEKRLYFWRRLVSVLSLLLCALLVYLAFTQWRKINYYEQDVTSKDSLIIHLEVDNRHLNDSLDVLYLRLGTLYQFTWQNINFWLEYYDIKYPRVAKAQIMLETGDLSSRICLQNNNLFGMKKAKYRDTTAKGTRYRHAYYDNFIQSIEDYKLWQDYFLVENVPNEERYLEFLRDHGYAEAKNYDKYLRILIEKHFKDDTSN